MNLKLKNKTVLITAASKGIGKATAEMFAAEEANVVICSTGEKNLLTAVKEIEEKTGYAPFFKVCDINNYNDIKKTVKFVKDKFGGVDILVNNCGGPIPGIFTDLSDSDWYNAVDQVLMSVVRFNREVLPDMIENNWGRIINITSLSVKQPVDNLLLSNALRSAVTAMAKTLSNQIGKYNITVNNVAPGYTLTSRLEQLALNKEKETGMAKEQVFAEMAEKTAMKRLAAPHEVAATVLYLASEQAGYITGVTVPVDGGAIKAAY